MSRKNKPDVKVIAIPGHTAKKVYDLAIDKATHKPGVVKARSFGTGENTGISLTTDNDTKNSTKKVKILNKVSIVKDSGQKLKATIS